MTRRFLHCGDLGLGDTACWLLPTPCTAAGCTTGGPARLLLPLLPGDAARWYALKPFSPPADVVDNDNPDDSRR